MENKQVARDTASIEIIYQSHKFRESIDTEYWFHFSMIYQLKTNIICDKNGITQKLKNKHIPSHHL